MKLYIYITDMERALKGEYEWSLTASSRGDMDTLPDWTLVGEVELDFNMDSTEMTKAAVEQIEQEREKVKAELSQKMQKLDDRKASLLAIEHKAA